MNTCPKCGASQSSAGTAFCPECGYSFSASRKAVGKHEIKRQDGPKAAKTQKSARKSAARSGRRSSKEIKPGRIGISAENEHAVKDDSYDGYYDDVLPTDDGEYRQGLDSKTVKNILYLLIGVIVVVGICVVILYYS